MKIVCTNRVARREYEILETFEAGLTLQGSEVKSLRAGKANLKDAYADIDQGELVLHNLYISPYEPGIQFGHEPTRRRRLLMHRREIERLAAKVAQRGLTIIPLSIYFKGPWAKVEIALARGKKSFDKRADIVDRETKREMARELRRGTRGGSEAREARGRARAAALWLGLALAAAAGGARAETAQVYWTTSGAAERVELWRAEGVTYLSAHDVSRWLRGVKSWDPATLRLTLSAPGHTVQFLAGNSWAVVDGTLLPLTAPARLHEGVLHLPVAGVLRIAERVLGRSARWDAEAGVLRLLAQGVNVLGVTMVAGEGGALRVAVSLAEPLAHSLDTSRPGEVRLRLEGGRIEADAAGNWRTLLPVRSVRAANRGDAAEITFELTGEEGNVSAYPAGEGFAVLLELTGYVPALSGEPPLLEPRPLRRRGALGPRRGSRPLVVVDPGHGGSERGAVGATGYLEKKAALEIARELERVLEADGYKVMLTRDDDQAVPLERRSEMANLFEADLFVSIHCNSWSGGDASGFEVYTLKPRAGRGAGGPAAAAAEEAAREGREALPGSGDWEVTPWEAAQDAHLEESRRLARLVREEMRTLPLRDRGHKEARFAVLTGVRSPAVLVETAFVSTARDELLLRDQGYRHEIGRAIAGAVRRFVSAREELEGPR